VDVIAVLTGSPNPQVYWRVMKKRLKDEGNEEAVSKGAAFFYFQFLVGFIHKLM
jgi:hypothetical protein